MEGSPVIRNEIPGTETLEQCERIVAGEMSAPKSGLPPGRISDREQSQVETASGRVQYGVDHLVCRLRETGVPGKEARHVGGLEQIHVRRTAPVIESIPVAAMLGGCRMDGQSSELDGIAGVDRFGLRVARTAKPPLDGTRSKDGNRPG